MSKIKDLPEQFIERMKKVLGEEIGDFLSQYEKTAVKALRFNTGKVRPETVEKLKDEWGLEAVPWCKDGYYYDEAALLKNGVRPGLSPYHEAGVFYIQEPSAMVTAEKAEIGPEDVVLDLCAAPGGKSTQAAAKAGLLLSNEPIPGRARILSSNIERLGFDNVVVCSAYPDELAACFKGFFDKIIVDAPCSGEGMMRKDETAINEWSPENVEACIVRQAGILEAAAGMVKPGGRIIYSTCTFEPGENEGQMEHFISEHPEFRLISAETMYPHKIKGEGHFCAVLEKAGGNTDTAALSKTGGSKKSKGKNELTPENIKKLLQKKKIHVLRAGVEPGETITDKRGKKRYEPSHAEALSGYFGTHEKDSLNLGSIEDAESYLKGNVLELDRLEGEYELNSDGGWLTVMYDGYSMGLGKLSGRTVKNHYPKGLRHF
ncbi:MAG: RNA methyltransferase [Eubacteriales bacterium]|nr:RNA methyltransferase [Eubacteriales bacterium]